MLRVVHKVALRPVRVQVQDNRLIKVLLIIKKIFKMLTSRK